MTQHIKRLEQSLNVYLIDRSSSRSTLTPEGRTFLPYAEHLLNICSRARVAPKRNSLAVGASSNIGTYLLQPWLRAFQQASPHTLELLIDDNISIAEKLKGLEIDVAAMEWWDPTPGFLARVWRSEELLVIVPPQHPWTGLRSIPRHWLNGQTFLGGERGTDTGRILQQYLGENTVTIDVSMRLGSTEAVKHAVHAGLGISLVMAGAVEQELRSGWLGGVSIEGEPPRKEIYLVRRESESQDAPAVELIDFLHGQIP